ncbi:MAG: hypothetical protein ACRDRX_18530 [Pseudonocardiaceae bacterium]
MIRRTARADALASALDAALDLVRDLAQILDTDRVRALTRIHAAKVDLARALGRARALARDLDFARVRVRDLARVRALNRDLARVRALIRILILVGTLDRMRVSDLDPVPVSDLDPFARDLNLIRAIYLDPTFDRARRLAVLRATGAAAGGVADPMPGRAARKLVALAVLLLPAAHRPRYREEFSVELVELPRRQQCGYALRLVASSWVLRRALDEAGRTPDGGRTRREER